MLWTNDISLDLIFGQIFYNAQLGTMSFFLLVELIKFEINKIFVTESCDPHYGELNDLRFPISWVVACGTLSEIYVPKEVEERNYPNASLRPMTGTLRPASWVSTKHKTAMVGRNPDSEDHRIDID